MTRFSKVGLVVAVLFTLVNLVGAVYAAAMGELLHSLLHVALLVPGVYFAWRLAPARYASRIWRRAESGIPDEPHGFSDQLTQLEQSVDAVAIEVERIGEGQRFMTRLFTEEGTRRVPAEGAAEPIDVKAPDAPPHVRRP